MGRLLDRGRRHGDHDGGDPVGHEHRALHVLSAAAGASRVLRRRHAARGRIVDLVRRDDRQLRALAARRSPAPRAAGRARDAGGGHHLDPGDRRPGGGGRDPHPAVVAGSRGAHRPDRGPHLLLVVRPPAHVLLARAGLRALVHGDPAASRAASCSATRSRAWSSSSSSCSPRRWGSTTSSPIPGIAGGWKLVHTFTTYAIMFPSLVTAFTVIASLEQAGRARGGTGRFGWIRVAAVAGSVLRQRRAVDDHLRARRLRRRHQRRLRDERDDPQHCLDPGAFPSHRRHRRRAHASWASATGCCRGSPAGPSPGRASRCCSPTCGSSGMQFFSIPSHIAGLMGMPRRVYTGEFQGVAAAQAWVPLVNLSAIGGVILFVSAMCYVGVLVATMLVAPRGERAADRVRRVAGAAGTPGPSLWDRLGLWTAVAVVLIVLAYAQAALSPAHHGEVPVAGVLAVLTRSTRMAHDPRPRLPPTRPPRHVAPDALWRLVAPWRWSPVWPAATACSRGSARDSCCRRASGGAAAVRHARRRRRRRRHAAVPDARRPHRQHHARDRPGSGRRLHRAVEHVPAPRLPGALGRAEQPLLLPVPQRHVRYRRARPPAARPETPASRCRATGSRSSRGCSTSTCRSSTSRCGEQAGIVDVVGPTGPGPRPVPDLPRAEAAGRRAARQGA